MTTIFSTWSPYELYLHLTAFLLGDEHDFEENPLTWKLTFEAANYNQILEEFYEDCKNERALV
mgnify:CR=1 FL=1